MLRELQCSNIGGDRPAVVWRDARGEGVHRAVAIRHHVEEMLCRCLTQAVDVIGWWMRKATLHDHAVAVAKF